MLPWPLDTASGQGPKDSLSPSWDHCLFWGAFLFVTSLMAHTHTVCAGDADWAGDERQPTVHADLQVNHPGAQTETFISTVFFLSIHRSQ